MFLISKTAALIISISIIVFLIVLFFVTFIKNRKTPVPKGCEHIKITEENCGACQVSDCSIKQKFDVEKLREELNEEEEKDDIS